MSLCDDFTEAWLIGFFEVMESVRRTCIVGIWSFRYLTCFGFRGSPLSSKDKLKWSGCRGWNGKLEADEVGNLCRGPGLFESGFARASSIEGVHPRNSPLVKSSMPPPSLPRSLVWQFRLFLLRFFSVFAFLLITVVKTIHLPPPCGPDPMENILVLCFTGYFSLNDLILYVYWPLIWP